MKYRIHSFGLTDTGKRRAKNEDALGIDADHELFVVADGMGGHASGEVASSVAVERVLEFFGTTSRVDGFEWPYDIQTSDEFEEMALHNAVLFANEQVLAASGQDARYEGMGTTLCAIAGTETELVLAHIGDSRIYRYRAPSLEQLTIDHSLLNHYRRTGAMSEEELEALKGKKNVIVRALGLKEHVAVDIQRVSKQHGDVYLLCSDGLTDLVDDWHVEQVVAGAHGDLEGAAKSLVKMANDRGGLDNISVLLLQLEAEGGEAAERARQRQVLREKHTRKKALGEMDVDPLETAEMDLYDDERLEGLRQLGRPFQTADTQPIDSRAVAERRKQEETSGESPDDDSVALDSDPPEVSPGAAGIELVPPESESLIPTEGHAAQTADDPSPPVAHRPVTNVPSEETLRRIFANARPAPLPEVDE